MALLLENYTMDLNFPYKYPRPTIIVNSSIPITLNIPLVFIESV